MFTLFGNAPYLNSRNYHLKNRTQADILLADKM